MGEESKVRKKIRPFCYVIGLVYTVVMVFVVTLISGSSSAMRDLIGLPGWGFGSDFLILWAPLTFLSLVLMSLPRNLRLTQQELTIIYSMSMLGALMPTCFGVLSWTQAEAGFGTLFPAYLKLTVAITNPLFAPKDINVIKTMIYGGPILWSAWTLPIVWWSVFLIVQNLLFMVTGSLLRRLYIDLVNLPFPTATGEARIIEAATNPEAKSRMGKWLLLGIILGVITTASIWVEPVFPGLGIKSQNLYIDLTPLALLPWVPLYFSFDTFYIAVGYFMPTDILLSTIIFYIVLFIIIPPIATAAGIFGPFPAGLNGWAGAQFWKSPFYSLMFGFPFGGAGWINWGQWSWGYGSIIFGGLMAYTLYLLFELKTQILRGLKGFFASLSGKGESSAREKGDISIRWLGIIFIVLFILYSAMLSYGTYMYVPIWVSLLYTLLFLFIFSLSFALARGYYCDGMGHGPLAYELYHPMSFFTSIGIALGLGVRLKPPQITSNARITYSYSRLFRTFGDNGVAAGASGTKILEMFKLGTLTKTGDKDIFIASIVGVVLAILISIPLWLWFAYTYGIGRSWTNYHGFSANFALSWIYLGRAYPKWNLAPEGPKWTVWLWYLLGAAIAIILHILRRRYPKFPLHPMGLVGCMMGPAVFVPWIIALILKHVTLRVGGFSLYEKKGVPIASGLLGGWATMLVISHVMLTLRQIGVIA